MNKENVLSLSSLKGFQFFTIYSLSNLKTKLEVALSPTQS